MGSTPASYRVASGLKKLCIYDEKIPHVFLKRNTVKFYSFIINSMIPNFIHTFSIRIGVSKFISMVNFILKIIGINIYIIFWRIWQRFENF